MRKTFKRGKCFLDYEIMKTISQGGFADIYLVRDVKTRNKFVLKTEKHTNEDAKRTINRERKVMEQLPNSKLFPKYFASGMTTNYEYIVMEPLGPSLTTMRKALPEQRYSIRTTLHLALEMLRCIESLHNSGYVHRDIKPGNFLIRPSRSDPVCLIDFGLARQHISNGAVITPRDKCGFVGTAKYASVNAHLGKELGRRDDLISWWYSIIELRNGALPWGEVTDRNAIYDAKTTSQVDLSLVQGLPVQIHAIWRCIIQYSYKDTPNYGLLRSFLIEAMNDSTVSLDEPFDWETIPALDKEHISVIPLDICNDEGPTIPDDLEPTIVPGEGYSNYYYSNSYDTHSKTENQPGCCTVA